LNDHSLRLLPLSIVLTVLGCSGVESAEAEYVVPAEHAPVHIEIASAYAPLSECLSENMNLHDASQSVALLERIDPDKFSREAAEVLGSGHPALKPSERDDSVERVRALIAALASLGSAQGMDTDANRAIAIKGIALVGVSLARADGDRCVPSENLLGWMAQVPPTN
jgi:hypothetical protein